MRVLQLGDWAQSDSGQWLTEWNDASGVPHVMPGFGPKHELSMHCWCHPVIDRDYTEAAVLHNVAN